MYFTPFEIAGGSDSQLPVRELRDGPTNLITDLKMSAVGLAPGPASHQPSTAVAYKGVCRLGVLSFFSEITQRI